MCVLITLSETLNPRQVRGFLVTFILIGSISILELISVLVNDGPLWLRWLNILSNYLGFGLTPAVPICLVYTLNCAEGRTGTLKAAVALEILYLLLLTGSLFSNGLVFSVDTANHYSRQSGFHIYMFISKSEAGTVFAGYVRAGRRNGLFFRTEHNKAQDEKKDGQTYKNGSIDHFFHPQHYDFCLGAHDQDLW